MEHGVVQKAGGSGVLSLGSVRELERMASSGLQRVESGVAHSLGMGGARGGGRASGVLAATD